MREGDCHSFGLSTSDYREGLPHQPHPPPEASGAPFSHVSRVLPGDARALTPGSTSRGRAQDKDGEPARPLTPSACRLAPVAPRRAQPAVALRRPARAQHLDAPDRAVPELGVELRQQLGRQQAQLGGPGRRSRSARSAPPSLDVHRARSAPRCRSPTICGQRPITPPTAAGTLQPRSLISRGSPRPAAAGPARPRRLRSAARAAARRLCCCAASPLCLGLLPRGAPARPGPDPRRRPPAPSAPRPPDPSPRL